ncbi:MAG: ABC transporter permease, partial [Candidatus Eisenbacteria bacterium]
MKLILESMGQDVRIAIRSLRRAPLFALTSIAIIALGAGAAGGMFGVVHHLLITPYVVPDPGRVVIVGDHRERHGEAQGGVSTARFLAYGKAKGLERLEAFRYDAATLRTREGSTRLEAARVTPGLFATLGVGMAAGRDFTASDGLPGAPATALVSQRLVNTRFEGDVARALGASLVLDGTPTQVVGVLRPASELPAGSDVWRPWSPAGREQEERADRSLTLVGRLRPAISAAALQGELRAIGREQSRQFPSTDADLAPRISSLSAGVLDEYSPVFEKIMLVALVFMLLVVAANLAGLQLARGAARQREWAVRAALGASPARLSQLSMIESLVLAALGGVAGLGVAA